MSGLIEFCVELSSPSGGAASVGAQDGVGADEVTPGPEEPGKGRGGRRGKLSRQDSVVCSRVQNLSTISYVDTGKEGGGMRGFVSSEILSLFSSSLLSHSFISRSHFSPNVSSLTHRNSCQPHPTR